jgi:hypothetical protein
METLSKHPLGMRSSGSALGYTPRPSGSRALSPRGRAHGAEKDHPAQEEGER